MSAQRHLCRRGEPLDVEFALSPEWILILNEGVKRCDKGSVGQVHLSGNMLHDTLLKFLLAQAHSSGIATLQ